MGCGKSSIGRKLSELLCCPLIDLDSHIEAETGRSIPEIFESDGEGAFRRMEKAALEKERRLQEAMLEIRRKYGKNAILKGTSLQEGATMRERNQSIGGHKA